MHSETAQPRHAQPIDAVVSDLSANLTVGLSQAQVRERRARHGPNRLTQQQKAGAGRILLHQVRSIIVWLLAFATLLSFTLGDFVEAIAIACVLIFNTAIGFFTELRAARSMEALLRIAEVEARVRRDGKVVMVDAQDLVPGDLVIIEAGDIVTADLRLVEAADIRTNESVLTGEAHPVAKFVEQVAADATLGDRSCMAFKGTAVTQGSGAGVVTGTGMDTQVGRISALAQGAEAEVAPLEKRLDRLGNRLVWLTLALSVLTIGAGLLRGHDTAAMVQTGIALAVAAVPEGLPVVATLCLARGMLRMNRRNALIRQLSSVETLGAATIILTDKTGTLTENRMSAARILLPDADLDVAWRGPAATFTRGDGAADTGKDQPARWALTVGALCNNADIGAADGDGESGDPMEIALLRVARAAGLELDDLRQAYPELAEYAFDPDLRMMATAHGGDGGGLVAVKGAPEALIARCALEMGPDGPRPLTDAARVAWQERLQEAAGSGLRLLGLAMRQGGDAGGNPYDGLTLVGLVGLSDPLRADIPGAIADCRAAGVRVVMLTGDHAATARTIAAEAGIGGSDPHVIEGSEIRGLDLGAVSPDMRERTLRADVFARVEPETKLKLVALYQQAGDVVAMTGDGVNDAPALKKADIGVAMGQRGTQVAQEAAHMVLRDDAFTTIVAAMRQGRVIYGNIRKFVVYLMSCNVSEVLVVSLAIGAGLPTPLLPLQILFLNLVTDVFPAFALGMGRGDAHVMDRPPRDPDEAIVDRARWGLLGALGAIITLVTLGAFGAALYALRLPPDQAVTVAFLTLALAQLWNVFNMRAPDSGLLRNEVTRNGYVWGALALCLVLIGGALWFPGAALVLGLPDPGRDGLVLSAGASLLTLVAGQVVVTIMGRRPARTKAKPRPVRP